MIGFLIEIVGLLSLFACAVAVNPVSPSQVTTNVISTFVINETVKIFSSEKINDSALFTPFTFTSMSETTNVTITRLSNTSDYVGVYSLHSSLGTVGLVFYVVNSNKAISLPTLGPCAANGLTHKQQHVWSYWDFSSTNLAGVNLSLSISRVYQDALLTPQVPQWILFGPGKNSYYAIPVPDSPNLTLQIEIRRQNSSVPSPATIFDSISLATEQRCLNPNTDNQKLPGIVEWFEFAGIFEPEIASHVFSASIPASSTIFVALFPRANATFNHLFSISASFVSSSHTPPNNTGTVLGVVFGVLIVVAALGIGCYLYRKKKAAEYKILT